MQRPIDGGRIWVHILDQLVTTQVVTIQAPPLLFYRFQRAAASWE